MARGARQGVRSRTRRWLGPRSWVSWRPNGIGLIKPNHYAEMLRTLWANRDQLPYAWRILHRGTCDGCALGTTGIRDWTLDGVHLCAVRLNLLRLNTMGAVDHRLLAHAEGLRGRSARELRELGRLPYPMVWWRGEPGFRRISWDEAETLAARSIRQVADRNPDRLSFYLTSRGITNEVYYAFQKVARFFGTNNVDNAARICHAPSTSALTETIGWGATTNTYRDWIGTDLLILVGSNLANNQPVAMKYLYMAKQAGTRVVVVNPYREEGLERYWVPSTPESAIFGTKVMDEYFQVQQGGDAAFFTGVLKHLIETDQLDHEFIRDHTRGFEAVRAHVTAFDWAYLERSAGVSIAELRRFAELFAQARTSIFVWSMGVTQHVFGTQNVLAISNLALALGRIGRPQTGLNPIRGHSGVQGGAEMGATPTAYGMGRSVGAPGVTEAMRELWGFDVPERPGLNATQSILAMHEGEIDLLYSVGGDFLETLPDPGYVRAALERVPVRVFQDIVINPMMLLDPGEYTLILPGATRYETPGGVTETSTERRVILSPEIPGRRIGEARPEWEIPVAIAARAFPERAKAIRFVDTAAIRRDIAQTVPAYAPIAGLARQGDQFQWGGERLGDGGRFNTADGRARFIVAEVPDQHVPDGCFMLSTRRGKQFNSMVWNAHDPLTGADRDRVFVSADDAERIGIAEGQPVLLRSEHGELRARVRITRIRSGNLQVHWPEGNVLIAHGVVDLASGEPDYNAVVELIPLAAESEAMR